MKRHSLNYVAIAAGLLTTIFSCQEAATSNQHGALNELTTFEQVMLTDTSSFYFVDAASYATNNPSFPIGIFDSGTGGLAVLDVLIRADHFKNGSPVNGSDGKPDFATEQFIYLADQANMPYGNYYATNKSDLLVEHVLKDMQFLLGNNYYPSADTASFHTDKPKIKALVIACNTATAYGIEAIRSFLNTAQIDIPVIGVIDAGAKGVLSTFKKNESGTIGVFATVGTIASQGYERTIMQMKADLGYTGDIQIVNQGGHGIAEAVDEENDYYHRTAKAPRENYRGPSLNHPNFKIDKALLDVYNFDFNENKMLCDSRDQDDCQIMQINSPENYVRYHLVSMLEKVRNTPNAQPLKAIVLGCTHYPFLKKEIELVLDELFNFQSGGQYVYRQYMTENIQLVDPSENVAQDLYSYLLEQKLDNKKGSLKNSQFFISVPNTFNPNVQLDENGRFTYDFKYGRNAGEIQEYVRVVPFSKENIPAETVDRLKTMIPSTFGLISVFN
jgi:glutamate racemase